MRRSDREITDINDIHNVVEKCNVVRMAMVDNGKPYVVPLNFGYEWDGEDLILYFHSAREGKKMNILKENPNIFFQMDCENDLVQGTAENPCAYSWRFDSIMGSGKVEFIEDGETKKNAMNRIISHMEKKEINFDFPAARFAQTCLYCVRSSDISAKRHP